MLSGDFYTFNPLNPPYQGDFDTFNPKSAYQGTFILSYQGDFYTFNPLNPPYQGDFYTFNPLNPPYQGDFYTFIVKPIIIGTHQVESLPMLFPPDKGG